MRWPDHDAKEGQGTDVPYVGTARPKKRLMILGSLRVRRECRWRGNGCIFSRIRSTIRGLETEKVCSTFGYSCKWECIERKNWGAVENKGSN